MQKKNILIIVIFFIATFISAYSSTTINENIKVIVSIERIDQSIKNDNGQVIAEIYYDKPVVT